MVKNKFSLVLIAFLLVFSIGLVSSQPPFQSTPQEAGYLIIETAHAQYYQAGTDFYVHAHIYDGNTGLIITEGVSCEYHFYKHQVGGNEHIDTGILGQYGTGFNNITDGALLEDAGEYSILIWCYTDEKGGFYQYSFYITPSGVALQQGTSGIYISLLFILVIFLILSLFSFVKFDNLLNRAGMLGLSYLFLLAISFISWSMARDFITSAPFITEMFWILFLILIISAFPLLIGGFVWYLLTLFKIKEIQNLMTKGFSFEEAETKVKNRRRRR